MNSFVKRSVGVEVVGHLEAGVADLLRARVAIRASSMLPSVSSGPLPVRPSSSWVCTEYSASSGVYVQNVSYCSTMSTIAAFVRAGIGDEVDRRLLDHRHEQLETRAQRLEVLGPDRQRLRVHLEPGVVDRLVGDRLHPVLEHELVLERLRRREALLGDRAVLADEPGRARRRTTGRSGPR